MLASCFCGPSLTWLPWLSTEAAGGHIRRSGVTAAAPHGETEVTALPETQQQIVRSLPVSTSTSCSKSFICSHLVSVDHSYNCNSQLLFCYQTLLIGLIPGLNSNKLYLNNFASWFDLNSHLLRFCPQWTYCSGELTQQGCRDAVRHSG